MRRAAAIAVVVLVAACASDGRTLRAPAPGASAPPLPVTTIPSQGGTVSSGLTLTSSAFASGGSIPAEFTCDGVDATPPLSWGAVPEGTVELAISVVDPDAKNFVHWAIAGIDPSVQALAQNVVPAGAVQAKNSGGTVGWTGPCPPKGAPHHYVFTLYALLSPSGLTGAMPGADALATLSQQRAETAVLTATYQRSG